MASRSVSDFIRDTGLAFVCLGFYANMTPFTVTILKRWIQNSDEKLKSCKDDVKLAIGGEHVPERVPGDVSVVKN